MRAALRSTSSPLFFFSLSLSPLQYADERDLPFVMALVDAELSEPYSIFTYR
jgi:peptide alpha-N-acetyltransferase